MGLPEANAHSIDEPELSPDDLQLRAQGHVGELPRQFSAFSTLSLAFSITNSWVGYSAVFVTPLYAGAGPAVFFCLIVASCACCFITAGLAELASAFPTSGGQYHFAYMVAPPKHRAVIAFTAGWLSVLAWLFTTASACIFCAQIIVNLASFYHPEYVWTQWQVWLIYVLIIVVCTAIVCCLPKLIPILETIFFIASVLAVSVFFITVLATSSPKQPAKVVFTDWSNLTGWGNGTAFLLGVGQAMYTFLGVDGATHISEEIPNPGKNVPQAMWLTVLIGFSTVVPWTIAFMFSTNDLESVAASYLPILEVFYQAVSSKGVAAFFTAWVLFVYFGACTACLVTTGRLAWAFSRDGGLPFSPTFAYTHKGLQVPVNATLLCSAFCILYGLIYIGSTTAFNSFISMAILSLNVTYAIPQGIAVFRGRDKTLPTRHFNLGRYFGPFCNIFSVLWVSLYTILFCFPIFLPATANTMNYVSVVLAGTCILILGLWWGGKRKTFSGPKIELDGLDVMNVANDLRRASLTAGNDSDMVDGAKQIGN